MATERVPSPSAESQASHPQALLGALPQLRGRSARARLRGELHRPQILSILHEDIKKEFNLSGHVARPAVRHVVRALLLVPRHPDRALGRPRHAAHDHRLALFVWSGMTALSRARGQLRAARAGARRCRRRRSRRHPAGPLADLRLFPPERRATPLAIYSFGIPIGGGLGVVLGGRISEAFGWRTAFLFVGIPASSLVPRARTCASRCAGLRSRRRRGARRERRRRVATCGACARSGTWRWRGAARVLRLRGRRSGAGLPAARPRPTRAARPAPLGTIALVSGPSGSSAAGSATGWATHDPRWYFRSRRSRRRRDPVRGHVLPVAGSVIASCCRFRARSRRRLPRADLRDDTEPGAARHARLASAVLLFIINLIGLAPGRSRCLLTDYLARLRRRIAPLRAAGRRARRHVGVPALRARRAHAAARSRSQVRLSGSGGQRREYCGACSRYSASLRPTCSSARS